MSPAEMTPWFDPVSHGDLVQHPLVGLALQLDDSREQAIQEAVGKQAADLNKFVEKYPEVGPYLQGVLSNPTPKIERDINKLAPYLDLEQEISKPEARRNIYNLAMKELGVQPSYLSQIELDYTSGETSKQREAIDRFFLLLMSVLLSLRNWPRHLRLLQRVLAPVLWEFEIQTWAKFLR